MQVTLEKPRNNSLLMVLPMYSVGPVKEQAYCFGQSCRDGHIVDYHLIADCDFTISLTTPRHQMSCISHKHSLIAILFIYLNFFCLLVSAYHGSLNINPPILPCLCNSTRNIPC
jgi:hypothetical protein